MDLRLVIRDGAWVLETRGEKPKPMFLYGSDATLKSVIATVAETLGLTEGELCGRMQLQSHSRARQIAILLIKDLFRIGRVRIGKVLGNRDVQTIWYSWDRAKMRMKTEGDFARDYGRAREAVLKMLEGDDG